MVLAAQPVLAAATCEMASPASCPMGMSAMGPDCAMAHDMADAACAQDCCNHALPQAAVITAIPGKPRAGLPAQGPAAVTEPLHLESVFTPLRTPAAAASSPPRYIRNQVFRI